ncbi:MAG: type I secretion system permease/ATPase [Beijerinckiaceae bacterium]|nr:type I secretion system permease/ATPase [Beijerinckiaceae bacterium]
MAQSKDVTLARKRALEHLTQGLLATGVFLFIISGAINVLALTGSFYMLQIYDRALTSGSIPTLAALSALAIALYLFQGGFDVIRLQVLVRLGARLDARIGPLAHSVAIDMPRFGFSVPESLERGRDVDTVRGFLAGQGPSAFFDLPWIPLYLAFIYLLHPWLGAMTIAGAFVLALLTLVSEVLTRNLNGASRAAALHRNTIADSNARNADVVKAMGFSGAAVRRFSLANAEHLELQTRTSDISGTFGAFSRVLRMLLQSALLGLGAYLTIKGELSSGAIIACSVASARALAPVDTAIGNWKGFVGARAAFQRLRETVAAFASASQPIDLPAPAASLTVEKLTVAAPGSGHVILSDVSFEVRAGQAVGIIGPSAGGKTTLSRAITGIWPALRGAIRLDGAELSQWRPDMLGQQIGYMPQDVSLLDASVEENIARLEAEPDARKIVEATRAAGVHEMIVRLPDGYKTQLGAQGLSLSAGQRQRIGLARALYGNPFLVVLDEPNSNLDAEGDAALQGAIESVRRRGGVAIVIAHRPSALAAVDLIGVVQAGKLVAFGPRDQILAALNRPVAQTSVQQASDLGASMRVPA